MNSRLYRRRTQRVFGGVASGLADYFAIDPVFVRLALVLLAFANGLGLLLYLILLVIVPLQPWTLLTILEGGPGTTPPDSKSRLHTKTLTLLAWSLIAVGGIYLLEDLFPNNDVTIPLTLMTIGAILLCTNRRDSPTIAE